MVVFKKLVYFPIFIYRYVLINKDIIMVTPLFWNIYIIIHKRRVYTVTVSSPSSDVPEHGRPTCYTHAKPRDLRVRPLQSHPSCCSQAHLSQKVSKPATVIPWHSLFSIFLVLEYVGWEDERHGNSSTQPPQCRHEQRELGTKMPFCHHLIL